MMSYTSRKSSMISILTAPVIFLCPVQSANSQSQNTTYTYGHDSAGNLNKITDPLGNITSRSFDVFNRVTKVISPPPKAGPVDVRSVALPELLAGIQMLKNVRGAW